MFTKKDTNKNKVPSILSSDTTIKGNLESTGYVQFDGNLEGDIIAYELVVSQTAQIKGVITADKLKVLGTVSGKIIAKSVYLMKSSHVVGDIFHETISIESGASVEGLTQKLSSSSEKLSSSSEKLSSSSEKLSSSSEKLSSISEKLSPINKKSETTQNIITASLTKTKN